MDKCTKCNLPFEQEDDRCTCNDNVCYHCCDCGEGCGCGCQEKK